MPVQHYESESEVTQSCLTLCNPWTVAHQSPRSMGFSRQEYWSGLPFPSPGDVPDPGIEARSPTLQADALTSASPGKPLNTRIQVLTLKISREERKPGRRKKGEEAGDGGQKVWPYRHLLPPTHTQALQDFSLGWQREHYRFYFCISKVVFLKHLELVSQELSGLQLQALAMIQFENLANVHIVHISQHFLELLMK